MKTLNNYIVTGALYQADTGPEAQVNDQVKLYLDTDSVPAFPEFIVGTIQHPIVKVQCNTATSYSIEYDEADLLGAADAIIPGNVIDAEVITAYDVLEDALNDEIDRATAAEADLQTEIDAEESRAQAEEASIRDDFAAADTAEAAARAAADAELQIRPLERTAAEGAPLDYVAGQAQIERLSPTGTVTTSGNAILDVTYGNLPGSPRAYAIPLLLTDEATEICTAIEAALSADTDFTDLFTITNNGTTIDITTKAIGGYFPANDATFELDLRDDTSVGVDTVSSTNQQAGIATTDATDPGHVGRWCRVGDSAPYDWYQAQTLTTWERHHPVVKRFPVDPSPTADADANLFEGDFIQNSVNGDLFVCTDSTPGAAVWKRLVYDDGAQVREEDILFDKTITPALTLDDQTINKNAGSINFGAATPSVLVTNSRVTVNSVILATVATEDATMRSVTAVAGNGSFVLFSDAAPTAETRVNFLIIN